MQVIEALNARKKGDRDPCTYTPDGVCGCRDGASDKQLTIGQPNVTEPARQSHHNWLKIRVKPALHSEREQDMWVNGKWRRHRAVFSIRESYAVLNEEH
jgi:hypothetical protein